MVTDNRETQPGSDDTGSSDDVPSANPAYATPPPEGIPDAESGTE
ncbi:hypothetical protein FHR72_000656 [Mycolicibacterium iranicum]|uniref:Uncharacterized protein n=1 Tax=Mycolicibacterium iranicum TaxID=912594 RepID=A0A839Q0B4_MYCIR|nr:hypothetical protein [Mycolicibacterium iranicum]MBB2989199.1 hypothetical protein [Mycolicibacterium iranicum]